MTTLAAAGPGAPLRAPAGGVVRRLAAAAAVAALVALVVQHVRLPPLCGLRAATGLPCPLCGGTTAVAHLGSGRPLAALAASPVAALGAPLWVGWPALRGRGSALAVRLGRRGVVALGLALVTAAQAWQLVRVLG